MESELANAISSLLAKLDQLLDAKPCKNTLVRLQISVSIIDLLQWFTMQSSHKLVQAYWSNRDGDIAMGGLASAWEYPLHSSADIMPGFQKARNIMSSLSDAMEVKCFSYFSFSDTPSQIWPEFGYGKIWLPLVELSQVNNGHILACNLFVDADRDWREYISSAKKVLHQLHEKQPALDNKFILSQPSSIPDEQSWSHLVALALHHLKEGGLNKVVLSKETRYKLKGYLSPWSVLQYWKQANFNTYNFIFSGTDNQYFFGCSPECLIKRHECIISTEALAGTSRRGAGRDDDRRMEDSLMHDQKNIRENQLVLTDIIARLKPLCNWLDADRRHSILKLKNIQHLRYCVRGGIKAGVLDEDIIHLLHPTPAVGGVPRDKARLFINENERYARGLYAGACGIIGVDMTELAVSIRSARLAPGFISLYAGAGIVRGSLAESEWQELDLKITVVREILSML